MTYLSSLSKAQLVELIQYAEKIDPKLPIYSPNTNSIALKMQLENDKREHHSQFATNKIDYEDLLVDAILAKSTGHGVEIAQIWNWIARESGSPTTVDQTFLQAATRALQRALRRGRILKSGVYYFVNTSYVCLFAYAIHALTI